MEVMLVDLMDKIICGEDIKKFKKKRTNIYNYSDIEPEILEKREVEGWVVDKIFSKKIRIKKEKSLDEYFEDTVWSLMSNLGFTYMNADRKFNMPYSSDGLCTQQIDVFAADEETALFIECKSTKESNKLSNFKKEIEAIGGVRAGIISEINKSFSKKLKVKFIFATQNFNLSEADRNRLKEYDICYFDEDIIQYYEELTKHLGDCAKYQLLGLLFENQKIPNLDNLVPAIYGSMGKHQYYSFSIEPERLLKISYVLHNSDANSDLIPAYQRIIKKSD